MRLPAWVLFLAGYIATSQQQQSLSRDKRDTGEKRVVCYYTNWSVYRPGTAKFNPQNINPYLCTHLIYAFGGLSKENSLKPFDKYQDIEQGGYAKFNGLKTYNKNLKTLLAIGGWNEGSARFSPLVADAERRKEFVRNIIKFLRQNHFDGLDLDWEYPSFRDGGKPRDRDNYATLVQELHDEFNRESEKTGRTRLLLTMAVPAGIEYIDKGYDVPKLNENLDWMNILSYDYHSAFEPSVDHHAPLFPTEPEGEYNFGSQLNIDATIQHYLKMGAERDKLVLGIPTYGRSYTLFNADATDIGSPADGPGEQGEATREKGYLAYYEICEKVKSEQWTVRNINSDVMGPYAYKGNQWVGYDDEDIVRAKAKYVAENDLGGIMFWSIDNDDFRGKCSGRPYPLIEAAKEALIAASNELTPSKPSSTPKPSEKKSSTSTNNSRPKTRKKAKTTTTERVKTSLRTTSTPAYSTTTPQPPTTPDPGSDFVCKDEGFFPHPRDCKKYFWCLDSGPSSLGIVAHQFTCPSGLVFNKISDSCDYTRNVICKNKPDVQATTSTTTQPTTTSNRGKLATTPIRTTSTTSTTTTTEATEYEEYEDDEEEEEEDPTAIKELLGLIKRLGGVEQLEKQLNINQGSNDKQANTSIKPSLYSKVLGGRIGNKYRGALQDSSSTSASVASSTARYNSLFRNRPAAPQHAEKEISAKSQEKPQYVTILRNRQANRRPIEEKEEDEEKESTNEETEEIEDVRKSSGKKSGQSHKEYTTLRRNKPASSDEASTTRYKNIQRVRSTTESSPTKSSDSDDDDVNDDDDDDDESDTTEENKTEIKIGNRKKYSSVYRERAKQEEVSDSVEEVSSAKLNRHDVHPVYSTPRYVEIRRTTATTATPHVNTENTSADLLESTLSSGRHYVTPPPRRTSLPTTLADRRRYSALAKTQNFTIVVPETTLSFIDETTLETTSQRPKTTSTVTRVITSITESSFVKRFKITKKPTLLKTSTPATEKVVIRNRFRSTTIGPIQNSSTGNRFRQRSTTTTEPTKRTSRGQRKFGDDNESSTTTTKRFLVRRISKRPREDLQTLQSGNYYDDVDDDTTTDDTFRGRIKARDYQKKSITEDEDMTSEPVTVKSTTTARAPVSLLRRTSPNYLNNLRSRIRSTTPTTSTTAATSTTSRSFRRQGVNLDRRRKFRPESRSGSSTTLRSDTDAESSTIRTRTAVRRRGRPTTASLTATSAAITKTTPIPPSITTLAYEDDNVNEDLPELADPAVVAIHNLAAVAPVPVREQSPALFNPSSPTPHLFTNSFIGSSPSSIFTPHAAPLLRQSPQQEKSVATSYADFRHGITTRLFTPSTTARVSESYEEPSTRQEVFVSPKQSQLPTTIRTTSQRTTTPKPIQPRRIAKPFSKVPKNSNAPQQSNQQLPSNDYEYYDDVDPLANVPPSALKVKVHSDGYIECLDQGNFPHPFSCKKFISCAKMDNTELLGWEYTCPKHLSFDPVGGICNWSAGLGCQH